MVQTIRQAIGSSPSIRPAWPGCVLRRISRSRRLRRMKEKRNGGTGGTNGSAEKLGYLGLGMMGFPMTRRLLNAGHDVTVWNRSAGKAAALVEAGAKLAGPSRARWPLPPASSSCASPMPRPWRRWCSAPTVLRTAAGAGKLVVDFSSIHPDAARAIAARLKTGERHGMDRCAGFRRHQGRRGRHARGDGRRRCRRHRDGCGPMCWRWRDGSRIWARPARARPRNSAIR